MHPGDVLSAKLDELDLKIAVAATLCKVDRTHLSRLINQRRNRLSWEDTLKVAETFDLRLTDLGYSSPPPELKF